MQEEGRRRVDVSTFFFFFFLNVAFTFPKRSLGGRRERELEKARPRNQEPLFLVWEKNCLTARSLVHLALKAGSTMKRKRRAKEEVYFFRPL